MSISKVLFGLLGIALAFGACKKDEEEPAPQQPQTSTSSPINQDYYVKCKVNGVDFLSKDDSRFNTARIVLENHNLVGSNDTTNRISIFLWKFNGSAGELNASTSNGNSNPNVASIISLQYLDSNPRKTYDCNYSLARKGTTSGKANITRFDGKEIEGTFEFTAVNPSDHSDKVTITEGVFKLKY